MHESNLEIFGFPMRKESLAAWIFRLLLLAAMLWASNTFVTKSVYELDKKDSEARGILVAGSIVSINNTLIRIDEKMKNDERQDHTLTDHEERLRTLERK